MLHLPGRPGSPGRPGTVRRWWAPGLQLVVVVGLLLGGAGVADAQRVARVQDLAAEQGIGPRLAVRSVPIRFAPPVSVELRRLGVRSTLVDLRKRPNGSLQVPSDYARAGWYVGSARPGDAGPTVLVGHVDSLDGPAVFFRLREAKAGDRVAVRRADGSTAVFVVREVRRVPKGSFPTAEVYASGRPGLRLVTCGGAFDRRSGHYRDNVIVFADLAVPARPPRGQ